MFPITPEHYAMKGYHENENILCWLDDKFVLTVIKTAYVTFAFAFP